MNSNTVITYRGKFLNYALFEHAPWARDVKPPVVAVFLCWAHTQGMDQLCYFTQGCAGRRILISQIVRDVCQPHEGEAA
jgi:hypothetical protein